MPVTPFHFGPGIFLKSVPSRHCSLTVATVRGTRSAMELGTGSVRSREAMFHITERSCAASRLPSPFVARSVGNAEQRRAARIEGLEQSVGGEELGLEDVAAAHRHHARDDCPCY